MPLALKRFRYILLVLCLNALVYGQAVLTDDANTSSAYPTKNFGSGIALLVCSGSNSYIKFSLTNLGPGITGSNASKATLILYTDFVLTPGTMDVYQVNGSWSGEQDHLEQLRRWAQNCSARFRSPIRATCRWI